MKMTKQKMREEYGKLKDRGFTVVKVKFKDSEYLDKLKLHRTEPKWSVFERIIGLAMEKEKQIEREEAKNGRGNRRGK